MKYILLLSLIFCISQRAFGVTRCFRGLRMPGVTASEVNCEVTESCSKYAGQISVSVAGINQTNDVEIGQCIFDSACPFMKCSALMNNLPSSMPGSFKNCRATCCKDGVCTDLREDGGPPISPYGSLVPEPPARETLPLPVPENMPALPVPEHMPALPVRENMPSFGTLPELPACSPPLWNKQAADNWNGLSRRKGKPTPTFVLSLKAVDKSKGYKSGKTYKYMLKSMTKAVKISGYFILLASNSSDCECKEEGEAMCPVGKFIGSRRRIAGAPVVDAGCDQPIKSENAPNLKKAKGTWRAPACTDAEIVMRAIVLGSDDRLYGDAASVSEKFLTKVIRPAAKKAKKPKKPKRRRN